MVDLAGWPCFFIGAVMSLSIGRVVGLAISGAVSIETDVAVLIGTDVIVGFSGCSCDRQWQAFEGAGLPMQASRYFLSQGSLSTRPDNRVLVAVLLTF